MLRFRKKREYGLHHDIVIVIGARAIDADDGGAFRIIDGGLLFFDIVDIKK